MNLNATEGELLSGEITLFGAVLRDPAARARYAELREAVAEGFVPDELLGHLGNVLEIGLQSGRLRNLYGADGEAALAAVFRRTPAGAALHDAATSVTHALSSLQGQAIEGIKVSALGPGSYGLSIDTQGCSMELRLDRGGVRVQSVVIGV
jgi:hypothetical protein